MWEDIWQRAHGQDLRCCSRVFLFLEVILGWPERKHFKGDPSRLFLFLGLFGRVYMRILLVYPHP